MDFDEVIDRSGTGALKWTKLKNESGKKNVIPLWVADMDFAAPDAVLAALRERVEHPVFGYTIADEEYFDTLVSWYRRRYGANIDRKALLLGPGVVPALSIAIRALTQKGDGILVMPPVYYPFFDITRNNERTLLEAPLRRKGEYDYEMDIDGAERVLDEAAAKGIHAKAIIFCSPHNPGGRVWSKEELSEFLAFAARRDLVVLCDEIHGDIVTGERKFVSLAGFSGAEERCIVFSAPNKTFNIAGLHLSHFVIQDAAIREKIQQGIVASGLLMPNVLALTAARAAYRDGEEWLDELIDYIRENIAFTVDFARRRIPGASVAAPDGTYLIWMRVADLIQSVGVSDDKELAALLEEEGRIKITPGSIYGAQGRDFIRINVACPKATLAEGLERFAAWVAGRPKV